MNTATRIDRLWSRQLTRAHLLLAERPDVADQVRVALQHAEAAWQALLPVPVAFEARLLETTFLPSRSLALQSAYAVMELSTVGARGVLEVDLGLVAALLRLFSGAEEAEAVFELTRAEQAAVAYLLLRGVAAARVDARFEALWSPRLVTLHTTRREALAQLGAEPHVGVDIRVSLGTCHGSARLLLPARALQTVMVRVPRQDGGPIAEEVRAARLSFIPSLGVTWLQTAEWEDVEAGDVVVLEGPRWEEESVQGALALRGSRFDLLGALSEEQFVFERAQPKAPREVNEMYGSEATVIQQPERLPVELEVELARIQLSVGTLAELKPGAVLPLHVRAGEPVLLRIGDRAVARAELVDVEGEVGARILALLAEG